AKVAILFGLGPAVEALSPANEIDVGQGDDVFRPGLGRAQVAERPSAGADAGDIQFLIGRFVAERLERGSAPESASRHRSGEQRAIEEVSSGIHVCSLLGKEKPPANGCPNAAIGGRRGLVKTGSA